MQQLDLDALKRIMQGPSQRMVIVAHIRPDGDAVGSSMGLFHILKHMGHMPTVVLPTEVPHNLTWLPSCEEIIIEADQPEAAKAAFEAAEAIWCLDMNALKRIAPLDTYTVDHKAVKVMIDHHLAPEGFHDFAYWDDTASSTAEMIVRLVSDADLMDALTAAAAQSLYMGILTDTGSFRFPSVTAQLHRYVADLIDRGAKPNRAFEFIYNNDSPKRLKVIGFLLNERLTIVPELHMAYMYMTEADMERFDIQSGDTEGLVNYPLGLRGINLSVIMKEKEGMVRMSFRSRGSFPANELAGHFNGGGHRNAAGGRAQASLEEVKTKLLGLMSTYADQLDYDVLDQL